MKNLQDSKSSIIFCESNKMDQGIKSAKIQQKLATTKDVTLSCRCQKIKILIGLTENSN